MVGCNGIKTSSTGVGRALNNRDIYLGFEYMETDLHNVIKRGNILKDVHRRYIMYQMLKATKYIHSGNVIHRDQKPSNVLIDSACRLRRRACQNSRSTQTLSVKIPIRSRRWVAVVTCGRGLAVTTDRNPDELPHQTRKTSRVAS
ncbi:Mitogen-activated protein kinase 15 [Eumeta japonica]|uniref:Mitogen-activated protein kinase 15 n=1 Tax=Eumeta variegata TaxID=151549 RepID=A0A4C1X0W7_EUMVA|nr:Mitogen-activated protein kinase 15 [Eumeta japonica]